MSNPKGCTSVEEWLARGGVPKTEPDPGKPIRFTRDGVRYEFVRDATSPSAFRCRLTGVYAYHAPIGGRGGVKLNKCRFFSRGTCGKPATVWQNGKHLCEDHA